MIERFEYDTYYFPFRSLFCDIIGKYVFEPFELVNLHDYGGFENVGDAPGKDNNSIYHDLFYRKMKGSYFMDCFKTFMIKIIAPKFNEPIVYQKYPTLRIQIPNGKGVAAYHVDSEYNHQLDSLNIWLPFTHAKDSSSIYIESEPDKGDYTPQDVDYGSFIIFDGCRLHHGNEINTTGKTRVSIDMRVIPLSKFKPSELKGLAHGKIRTTEGENAYYSIIK